VLRTFALAKTYTSGAFAARRVITRPVAGSVRVAIGGVEARDFALDAVTGTVTFATPPGLGADVTAGFEFDVPARFDTDLIQVSVASFQAGEVPRVPVVEVRE